MNRDIILKNIKSMTDSLDVEINKSAEDFRVGMTCSPLSFMSTPIFKRHISNIEFKSLINELRVLVTLCKSESELQLIIDGKISRCDEANAATNVYRFSISINDVGLAEKKYELFLRYRNFLKKLLEE